MKISNIYTIIAILGLFSAIGATGIMAAYSSNHNNDDNENDEKDPMNKACYNSGYKDGQKNSPYNQTMYNQCGKNNRAYYEGFLSGCISGHGGDYFTCQKMTNSPVGGTDRNTNR